MPGLQRTLDDGGALGHVDATLRLPARAQRHVRQVQVVANPRIIRVIDLDDRHEGARQPSAYRVVPPGPGIETGSRPTGLACPASTRARAAMAVRRSE